LGRFCSAARRKLWLRRIKLRPEILDRREQLLRGIGRCPVEKVRAEEP
jgi:hypothetical protein